LQLDVTDDGLPIRTVMASASIHDSKVAIPLMRLTASKVVSCYDLMDAAYNATQVWAQRRELGHVPIIDAKPKGSAMEHGLQYMKKHLLSAEMADLTT